APGIPAWKAIGRLVWNPTRTTTRASARPSPASPSEPGSILWARYDAGVSGKDPIEGRPGFKALLERVAGNGVRVVIVEDASRFARHLLTQEAGISLLVGLGVRVLTAAGDGLTDTDMNSGPPCGRS